MIHGKCIRQMADSAKRTRLQPIKRKEVVSPEMLISLSDHCINNTHLNGVTD